MRLRSSPALRATLLVAGLALVARGTPAVDLDVAVPPGSPLDWGRSFPGYTPHRRPLLPVTGQTAEQAREQATRTRATASTGTATELDVRFASSFGMLRILTWDLAAHLAWIGAPASGPVTGTSGVGRRPPTASDPLYWVSLAPLLRLLLHPQIQSRSEALAHLVEIGTPVHSVLRAAAGEQGLESEVATLRRLIPVGAGLPVPADSGSPRERMLARFVMEQLLADTPYDPTGEFGKRLFLFSEEALPFLELYAEHPSAALARAAVSALGRYANPSAAQTLVRVAARATDPVTCVRALAALGPVRAGLDEQPLIERLGRTTEPVLRAALLGALGRLGSRPAIPALVALGEEALGELDSDLLITVLSALARIWPADDQRQVVGLLARHVRERTRRDRGRWSVQAPRHGEPPDRPDPPTARARLLEQLAAVLATQAAPGASDTAERLLELAEPGPAVGSTLGNGPVLTDPHASLYPLVRFLYLDALGRIGERGVPALEAAARAAVLDPAERGRAIANLPYGRRAGLALGLYRDENEPAPMRVETLELLLAEHHAGGTALCREILKDLAAREPGSPDSAQRFLAVRALRELGDAGTLPAELVLPLLPHVRRSPAARRVDRARIRAVILELVEVSARRGAARRLDDEIRALVDEIVRLELRAEPEEAERKMLENGFEKALGDVPSHESDGDWRNAFVERWLTLLCGPPLAMDAGNALIGSLSDMVVFQPSIPLEEEIVLGLGRTRSAATAETLLALLREETHLYRAWVCLAAGMSGFEALAPALLPALEDPDPFVRLCAYESLRRLSGRDLAIDWMYGPAEERALAAEEYRLCLRPR